MASILNPPSAKLTNTLSNCNITIAAIVVTVYATAPKLLCVGSRQGDSTV